MCPGVYSASKNEYQGFPLGVKAAGAWGWRPTTLVVPNVKKIRGLNLPGTPLGTCGLLCAWPLHTYLGRPIKLVRHNAFPSLATQFGKHCCTLIQASRRKIKKQIGDYVWSRKVPEVNYAAFTGTINKLPWNRTFIIRHLYHMSL
jgi:hypothetical protein